MDKLKDIFAKVLNWVKAHGIILTIAIAILIVLIIIVNLFTGGPKKAVKKYVSAMNSLDADKVVKCIDFVGKKAWGYSFDEDDFSDEDYEEFLENYEDIDEDDVETTKKNYRKSMVSSFANMEDEYKSVKVKLEEIKSVKKIGKNLYVVKAKISTKAKPKDKDETDEIDQTDIETFVVYKNKIISFL